MNLAPTLPLNRRKKFHLFLLVTLVLATLSGMFSLLYPFARDQGVFACVASQMLKGNFPYKDVWDLKPPGVFFCYSLAFLCLGKSMLSVRIFDLLYMVITTGVIYFFTSRRWDPKVGLLAGILFSWSYFLGHSPWDMAQADGFLTLPLILASFLYIDKRHTSSSWRLFFCGLLLGFAFCLKYTSFLLLLVIFCYEIYLRVITKQERSNSYKLLPLLTLLGGFLVFPVLVLLYLLAGGAVKAFWETTFVVTPKYTKLGSELRPISLLELSRRAIFRFIKYQPLLIWPLMIGLLSINRHRFYPQIRLLLVFTLTIFAGIAWQQRYFYYHWLPLFPFLAVFGARGMVNTFHSLKQRLWRNNIISVCLLIIIVLAALYYLYMRQHPYLQRAYLFLTGKLNYEEQLKTYRFQDIDLKANLLVSEFIKKTTKIDDYILVWGFEPMIYFLADRRCPSRLIFNLPLIWAWTPQDWRQEFFQDFKQKTPTVIVVVKNDSLPLVSGFDLDSVSLLKFVPQLERALQNEYKLVEISGDLMIFARLSRHP